ncbi:DUF1330 domain-containing protein [Breoghania sp. L-A4]|uniref:DUF1330 domain-containing protein n=1 Tax=Breoghania sp. L-A4 TaxID=2304600 RepID=UPI000E360367|nr:DUF1330 domain-containing protein [Breoghania sp. L-A4]AXS38946.1 DUF1330 domain-containing protein [Breoghania sp. L-A4]
MTKGYWVARVDVQDPEAYKEYVAAGAAAFSKYGARFLARGGKFEKLEGTSRARNVLIEFESYEQALACYNSPEYQKAKAIRTQVSEGDLIIIDGYDGPQP